MWSGSIRKWPRRESGIRMSHERSLRPPRVIARPGQPARQRRRVVDLQPGLGDAAAVAQRVGDPDLVADVAVELAHRVAGLQVGQAEANQDVRAADDEDRQVEQVEQEGQRGRERRDHQDHGGDEQLELADHRADPACRLDRALGVGGGRASRGRAQVGGSAAGRPDPVDRRRFEQLANDLAGLDVMDRRARLDDQAMGQGRLGQRLDVVGDDVVAAEQAGERLAGPVERDRAARARRRGRRRGGCACC